MSKIVALEFSPHAIRAAEIKNYNSKKPKLVKVGEVKLDPEVSGETTVYDKEMLIESLKTLWRENGFGTKVVALIASGRKFTVRSHTTTHTSPRVIKNMLPLENQSAIPDLVQDPVYDFYPTKEYEVKGSPRIDGLAISTPSESILDLVFVITSAKLALEYVDFAPLGVHRFITRNYEDLNNYILINVRDESSDIVIVKDKIPLSIRVTAKGLDSDLRRLGRHGVAVTEVSFEGHALRETEAQMLMRDIEMTVNSQDSEVIQSMEKVFISGPRANDEELNNLIRQSLNLQTQPLYIEQMTDQTNEDENLEPSFDEFVVMCGGIR